MFLYDLICQDEMDKTAVHFVDEQFIDHSISYGQLFKLADRVCQALIALGVKANSGVGILLETSVVVPSVLIGVMKSGGYFMSLNPYESTVFLKKSIERASLEYLITTAQVIEKTSICSAFKVCRQTMIDNGFTSGHLILMQLRDETVDIRLRYGKMSIAYAMQTSGTTGDFKLVLVDHRCIVPNILQLREIFNIDHSDVCFVASPLTFDPSIVDIFLGLSGGSIVLLCEQIKRNVGRLSDLLFNRFRITYLQVTPSFFYQFPSGTVRQSILNESSSLRILAFGGEICPTWAQLSRLRHPRNATKIFNLYGITEMSCWATFHQLTPNESLDRVPIGKPLMETEIKLTVEEEDPEILIGSSTRICLVDEAETPDSVPYWRHTGDVGLLDSSGHIYVVGRKTFVQVKRQGKRIDLGQIDLVIRSTEAVKSSYTFLCDDFWLVSVITLLSTDSETAEKEIREAIHETLPQYCQPDRIIFIDSFPITAHGKVDRVALIQVARTNLLSTAEEANPEATLRRFIEEYFVVPSNGVDLTQKITTFGADSLKIVQLISLMEQRYSLVLPDGLSMLLSESLEYFLQHLTLELNKSRSQTKIPSGSDTSVATTSGANEISINRHYDIDLQHSVDWLNLHSCTLTSTGRANLFNQHLLCLGTSGTTCNWRNHLKKIKKLTVLWRYNLGKCIDASPLVVADSKQAIVYIGSHSHVFVALNIRSGEPIWRLQLEDRIEAAAVLSPCQRFVIVGCYNGSLNFIDRITGIVKWIFRASDAIKCSAVAWPGHKIVFVGSHDKSLYCLHYQTQRVIWKRQLDGAIFSTPALHPKSMEVIFTATLASSVYALNCRTGAILWSISLGSPIFSSLVFSGAQLLVGCVNGDLVAVDPESGERQPNRFKCSGPLFSTPTVVNGSLMLLASHDRHLYAVNSQSRAVWKTEFSAPLAASPFVVAGEFPYCVATETVGLTTLVNLSNGKKLQSYRFNGETFSSPVVFDNFILQGCRDDHLYCLKLS